MDDGYGMHSGSSAWTQGYDIDPDHDMGMPVDMIYLSDGTLDVQYQQVFIRRPPNGIFQEPLDLTPDGSPPAAESRSTMRAADSKFYSEAERIQTFKKNWLDDYPVKPADLARDGFVHIGSGDKVKCVFCLKTLSNWEPSDSVEKEHRRHYPQCPFVLGKCDELNIPINPAENMKRSFGLTIKSSQANHTMQDFSDRLNSFNMWPRHAHMRPDALAEAGFFYCGTGDKVICFTCGKSISDWEPGDDPWVEHAKWSPGCSYLHSVKGSEYIRQVQEPNKKGQMSVIYEPIINLQNNFAAASLDQKEQPTNKLPQQVRAAQQAQTLHYPVQVLSGQIEDDLKSTPVMAVLQAWDVPVEKMRQQLEKIRLSKGTEYKISSKDLEDMTDYM